MSLNLTPVHSLDSCIADISGCVWLLAFVISSSCCYRFSISPVGMVSRRIAIPFFG